MREAQAQPGGIPGSTTRCSVGIDGAKAWLDVAVRPSEAHGIPTWSCWKRPVGTSATQGRRRGDAGAALAAALAAAGLPVVVSNPRQGRDLAKATGRLAKTDTLDAHVLAHFAEAVHPEPRRLSDEATQQVAALLERRAQVVGMLTAEKTRRHQAVARVRPRSEAHLAWLEAALDDLNRDLDQAVHASPLGREREEPLRSVPGRSGAFRGVPGVGPILALTLLADLPEWGTLAHKQRAALVGVAPLNRASGSARGKRLIWGGRAPVRTALSISTLSAVRYHPVLHAFSTRLREQGKPPTVALVACMHQLLTLLNAMLTHQTPWQPARIV